MREYRDKKRRDLWVRVRLLRHFSLGFVDSQRLREKETRAGELSDQIWLAIV
jgi:hypothetical protein